MTDFKITMRMTCKRHYSVEQRAGPDGSFIFRYKDNDFEPIFRCSKIMYVPLYNVDFFPSSNPTAKSRIPQKNLKEGYNVFLTGSFFDRETKSRNPHHTTDSEFEPAFSISQKYPSNGFGVQILALFA